MRSLAFDVSHDELRRLMSGSDGTDLRLVPGSTAMRIVGVTPSSLAASWGAENDDTIETINDEPLSSVSVAYEIAAKALRAQQIVIKGRHRDQPYTTVLRIRA